MDLNKVQKQGRDERTQKTTLLWNDGGKERQGRLPYICCVHKFCLKSLVASCVCVAEVRMHVSHVLASNPKVFVCSTINVFVFYSEVHLETPSPQKSKNGGKSSLQNLISSRDGPEKVRKQGRDEGTQEDYPTSAVYFCRCRVDFLHSFISALFLYFFQLHPYLK